MNQTKLILPIVSMLILLIVPPVMGQSATLVSVNNTGTGSGKSSSYAPVVSANKQFVAFSSKARDLVSNDTNGAVQDIFVRNLVAGTTTLVSINHAGTGSGNNESGPTFTGGGSPLRISADGRFVAFVSKASDLVANDTNTEEDVFVRDLQLGITKLVSINSDGSASGNSMSGQPVMSPNGRYVAFSSGATDLVTIDNANGNVFIRDLVTNKTTLVSINSSGIAGGSSSSFSPTMSSNGRFVAFVSFADDLVTHDTNGNPDVFVRDLTTRTTTLVSRNRSGTDSGNDESYSPAISANGRFVAFDSRASNLATTNDTNGSPDVFVRDLTSHTTSLVSINQAGSDSGNAESGSYFDGEGIPAVSADGRFIAFDSLADDLATNDTNANVDVFVRDLIAGTTSLVSINSAGTDSGDERSSRPVISPDGKSVAFVSLAGNLVSNDTNRIFDVFVRDLKAGTTALASLNNAGTGSANCSSAYQTPPAISGDGRLIVFDSCATNLIPSDTNRAFDVFAVSSAGGTLEFGAAAYSVDEGIHHATIKVKRTGSAQGSVSVDLVITGRTATAGSDFTPISGTLTFASGQTSKTLSVPVANDNIDEDDEDLVLTLTHPTGGALLGAHSSTVLNIIDNDLPPGLSINDVTVTEGNTGTTSAVFTVSLSAASSHTVTVKYKSANGTASSVSDYVGQNGRLTFTPGQVTKTITVAVKGDTQQETNETFNINLSAPTNATIVDESGTCTIFNND